MNFIKKIIYGTTIKKNVYLSKVVCKTFQKNVFSVKGSKLQNKPLKTGVFCSLLS